jgi:hypothetical protein
MLPRPPHRLFRGWQENINSIFGDGSSDGPETCKWMSGSAHHGVGIISEKQETRAEEIVVRFVLALLPSAVKSPFFLLTGLIMDVCV